MRNSHSKKHDSHDNNIGVDDDGGWEDVEEDDESEEGSSGESSLDEGDQSGDADEVFADPGYWAPEVVAILQPYKEKWIEGNKSDKVKLLDEAVKKIQERYGRQPQLKKSIKKWLQCRSILRKKYGPGRRPSLRMVVCFYWAEKIAKAVKAKIKINPEFDNKEHIGIYSEVVSKFIQTLISEGSEEDLEKMEEKRREWSTKGPPMEIQRR